MSRMDDLIAEHCPDGVEHRMLGDIAHYSRERVSAYSLDEFSFVGVDNLIADKGGKVPASYRPNSAMVTSYNEGDVLIGNIRPYLKKIWLADNAGGCSGDVLAVRLSSEFQDRVDSPFLYYVLSSDAFFTYNMQNAKGARMPRGSKDAILKYRIPLPPLEVQREIVRVLDLFQSLEAELEAELEARRRQYAHYRDSLLDFSGRGVRWLTMGEAGTFFGGLTGKSKADFETGSSRFVTYMNVFSNIVTNVEPDDRVRIGDGENQRRIHRGDVLFTGSSESQQECGMSSVVTREPPEPLYLNSFCIGYRMSDLGMLDPEFAKHLFRSSQLRGQIVKTANGVTRFNVSKSRLAKVRIPVPDIGEQKRIAEILDKFDALVNDLSIGLPAELAARRRQYEYYRDRLLTFEEAA